MGREPIRTETDLRGNKVDVYDDHKETHDTDFRGHEVIHISKDGEEIGTARVDTSPFGVTTYDIETSDGDSYTSRYDPDSFISSNNSTNRDGKSTDESYAESIVNHQKELADNLSSKKESSNNYDSSSHYEGRQESYLTSNNQATRINRYINCPIEDPLNSKDIKIRGQAVSVLKDQDRLNIIANKDPSTEVRKIAISKLKDQYNLRYIAECGQTQEIRDLAMSRITDDYVLTSLAQGGIRSDVRSLAMDKLEDTYKAMKSSYTKRNTPEYKKIAELIRREFLEKIESLVENTKDKEIKKELYVG